MMNSRLLLPAVAVVLTAAVSLGMNAFAQSFTEPASAPPTGNASAPLDTSSNSNTKVGGLLLNTGGATNGLIVQFGNVGIGATSPLTGLHLKSLFTPGYMQLTVQSTVADDRSGISLLNAAGTRIGF